MEEKREKEEEEEEWLVGRCRPVEAWPAANWPCNALMLPDPGCPPPILHCSSASAVFLNALYVLF